MDRLPDNLEKKLTKLATALIDQKRARTLVEPNQDQYSGLLDRMMRKKVKLSS